MSHWDNVKLPPALARRPRDPRGYPVPFTTALVDGVYDFRVIDPAAVKRCVSETLCAICGLRIGGLLWFIGGPKVLKMRLSLDAPMCRDCADFSLQVCPHLALRDSRRREVKDGAPVEVSVAMDADKPEAFYLIGSKSCRFVEVSGQVMIEFKRPEAKSRFEYASDGRLARVA